MMKEIEKNIPIPKRKRKKDLYYPFRTMKIGDSFFVANKNLNNFYSPETIYRRFGIKTKRATVDKNGIIGIRVWRIS